MATAATTSDAKTAAKPTARRDFLRSVETKVQAAWAKHKVYEIDAPANDAKDSKSAAADGKQDKYLATFPYPYMNGVLHLGHAFTLTKAEFMARFQRLLGKKVLFPFGFHCTGMPICACADKLKREIAQFGNPPKFPAPSKEDDTEDAVEAAAAAAAAPATAAAGTEPKKDDKKKADKKEKSGDKKKADKKTAPAAAADATAATAADAAPAEDATAAAAAAGPKKINKKGKAANKKSKQTYQWNIMKEMGVPESEISKFQDPVHWLSYFPPIGADHLAAFGSAIDFRRSFITTNVNPYYDSFIRWQFNTLKAKKKVNFGKRIAIYSPGEDQPCADHDRASGEGVGPQEYTLIKLKLVDVPAKLKATLAEKKMSDRTIVLPAATLRPETMYGQTNLWVLPEGQYGVYEMKNSEIYICSERSALNMSYQDMTHERGKPRSLGTVAGADLIGCAVTAPLVTAYPKVYILPLLTISMTKGTGVVTSVPSDAPDDYAALMDLKKKAPMRQKYGLADEKVLPFEPIPIIQVPELGDLSAVKVCTDLKVASQNDKAKLLEAKEKVYLEGFYKGVMKVGEHKGKKVADAKPLVRAHMIAQNEAAIYSEPESTVIARTGEECVCALTDQWYLQYGENEWKQQVDTHVRTRLNTYSKAAEKKFCETVAWLHEWACSRSYGLGTRVPFDSQFVIESLSDSTIYMAYYAVAHLLQGGVLNGSVTGPSGIKPAQLTDAVWNYIFLHESHSEVPAGCGIEKKVLDQLRAEFEFWYPLDLRVSGKDLIGNHLTMSLYNHSAIWPDQPTTRWPRSFYTNGHLMINAEKMSKSTGNFMTILEAIHEYSADATRLALADAGDGLDDANFDKDIANASVLRLFKEEAWIKETLEASSSLRKGASDALFADRVFDNEIRAAVIGTKEAFTQMKFKEGVRIGVYELLAARDDYRQAVKEMHIDLVTRYIEALTILISPIAPHWAQHVWELAGHKGFVIDARWPTVRAVDADLSRQKAYLSSAAHSFRVKADEQKKKLKTNALNGQILVAAVYPKWQAAIISLMKSKYDASTANPKVLPEVRELGAEINALDDVKSSKFAKQAMLVAAQVKTDFEERGVDAFELKMPFNEIQLLKDQIEVVTKALGLLDVQVVEYEDGTQVGAKNIPLPGRPILATAVPGAAPATAAAGTASAAAGGSGAAAAKPKADPKPKADKKSGGGGGKKEDKKKAGDKKAADK